MRLLLINPKAPESFWSFRWAVDSVLPSKRSVNPPLGLATVAALTPESWTVQIVDENVESIPLDPDADLIGVGGMGVQFPRQKEILSYYRGRGYYVVAGGSYASLCPEQYEGIADTVISGEAEDIWPEFCGDFERGTPRRHYVESGIVDLQRSPVPRFDLLPMDRYVRASVQFSRGCPFRCEFCDIIVMFGRKPRSKTLEQIRGELDALRALGVHEVFFVDDNFIGDKRAAKQILRFLIEYQQETRRWFNFGTEASINVAQDPELLDLLRSAGFVWLFIGIESPDQKCLEETGKLQNMRQDMLASIREIYAHGIDVFAGFIIGFDHDTLETFDKQSRFIAESGIQAAMLGLLVALPRTPLHERLAREGRLTPFDGASNNTGVGTNVMPLGMRYDEMVARYKALYQSLSSDRGIAQRIVAKLRWMKRPTSADTYHAREAVTILWRFVRAGLRRPEIVRWVHFWRTIALASPRQLPQVINDWIVGISMSEYVRRHFADPTALAGAWSGFIERIERRLKSPLAQGAIGLWFEQARENLHVSIRLEAWMDRSALRRTGRQLASLLKKSQATITLHVEQLDAVHMKRFRRLLRRLASHGDRISVAVSAGARAAASAVDSSVFHLVLAP